MAAVAVALVAALLVLRPSRTAEVAPPDSKPAGGELMAGGGDEAQRDSQRREPRRPPRDPASRDAEAVSYLREQFGATISHKHTQIKAIEKLLAYLRGNYPDDWQDRVQAMLAGAFPGLASQLFAQYQNMTAYNDWMAANREELAKMSGHDRREALRDARFRFFGEDAAEIWEEEFRHSQIYDAMDAIRQSPDSTLEDKLTVYRNSIDQAYGDAAGDFIERRQTELLTKFLELPTVQQDLHRMNPAQRSAELERVREAMGLDEEARARWRDLDHERDQAWEVGDRYMRERDRLSQAWEGDERTRRLDELRAKHFGADADTIRQEEEAGFFRYGHKRVIGKE
jgi:hypothetical protein